jgi:cellulose biosynthesis protein BcsQ
MADDQSTTPQEDLGKVFTFYSYKGGVGRSMALVNAGVLLAMEGHRVLMVDWDLEAPGLETFFVKSESSRLTANPETTPGVLDLLEAKAGEQSLHWKQCLLRVNFKDAAVDLISAGKKTSDYRKRVQQLDWRKLFKQHSIGNYLDGLRDEWRRSYDFILVDSRTGITDIGDICTVILPDVIVALFVANHQNVDGVKDIVQRARLARRSMPVNRSMLMVLPIPGRDESKTEYEMSMRWRDIFEREFGPLFNEWLPKEISPSEALSKLFIPYVPIWSFGERIPVLEGRRELQDPTSIGAAYLRLATLISSHLDWYAVFEKTDIQELRNTKIELDSKQREYEVLRSRQSELKRRNVFISASLAVALLSAGVWVFYLRQESNLIHKVVTLQLCRGDSPQRCGGSVEWIGCQTDPTAWARQKNPACAKPTSVRTLSDVAGGQCGYQTIEIKCE